MMLKKCISSNLSNNLSSKISNNSAGFTLLEVMVALTIIAISLGALLSSSGAQARNATYLKQKTLAHIVAMNELTELLASKKYPTLGKKTGSTEMANNTWYWERTTKKTQDKNSVQVSFTVSLDEDKKGYLTKLIGYASR